MNTYAQSPHGGLYGMKKFRKTRPRSSFHESSKFLKIWKKNKFPKKNDFSGWEKQILKKLRDSGISIETKFRNFPLNVENEKFEYVPDFLMKGFEYKGREVLVEAHEKISEEDVKKYRKFRSVFGSTYYLIMIVTDGELRSWNEYDQGVQGFFNEIWAVGDIEILTERLRKMKNDYEEKINSLPQNALCPKCGKKAAGYKEIVKLFGYRGKIVQSFCGKCRSK